MELDALIQWLKTFPLWEKREILPDCIPNRTQVLSVIPQGSEIVSRKEDLLGNCRCVRKDSCLLYISGVDSPWQEALSFIRWVDSQNAQGLCPVFGAGQTLSAQRGRLLKTDRLGLHIYEVSITATYEKIYKEKNNGED